jgi:hypothetical protein
VNRRLLLSLTALYASKLIPLNVMSLILALTFVNIPLSAFQAQALAKRPSGSADTRKDSPGYSPKDKDVRPAQLAESYGKLPLSFEKNNGQTDSSVNFLSRGSGYSIFLTQTEAMLVLSEPGRAATLSKKIPQDSAPYVVPDHSQTPLLKKCALRMRFVGANPKARAEGHKPLLVKSNYFIGNNPKDWRAEIPNYSEVRYGNAYPGVDLIYYGNQRQLEYDFLVSPGADARVIRIAFDGARSLRIDENGDLVIHTPGGVVRHHKPSAYQEVGGIKRQVSARYILKPKHQVGIVLGAYDKSKRLLIDPVLSYSTFLGGNGDDEGQGIAVDAFGNAYLTGLTQSLNFPKTPGAYQETQNQFAAVFVSKLNPAGSALIYSTYLGGNNYDAGYDIAIDATGAAYVTGITTSTNFPTTAGAFQVMRAGSSDAFVTKLNATGSSLVYSTYVGGTGDEFPRAIAVDAQGSAHITGLVTDGGFPVTPGAFQTTFRGGYEDPFSWGDAYVCKLNANGTGLIYATYLGGAEGEIGNDIAIDFEGYAYVTGGTDSIDYPITPGAYQTQWATTFCPSRFFNCADAFVTKFNLTGTAVIYSTYVGGNGGEYGNGIAVDLSGNAIIAGSTFSTNFPTVNSLQSSFAGARDAFVTKLNAAGSAVLFSTYFGRSELDDGEDIALDAAGNAYLVGYTGSTDLPVVNAIQPTLAGAYDVFVAKINTTNATLSYCTYLGGSNAEGLLEAAIAVDQMGSAYLTGHTQSSDFPTTATAYQTTFGGGDNFGTPFRDAFVAKISDGIPYDICLQDESNGNLLQINTTTGEYQLINCGGLTLGGTGTLTKRGSQITLQHSATDRRIMASLDTSTKRATASVQLLTTGRTLSLTDRNITNNTCACR